MAKERAELLLEHYEASVETFRRDMTIRGRIGFGLLAVVLVLLFRVQTPDLVEGWVETWVRRQVAAEQEIAAVAGDAAAWAHGTAAGRSAATGEGAVRREREEIDFDFLTTVVWFGLSSLLILYLRWSLILERQGAYLRELETRLAESAGGAIATQFGDLREDRPLFFRVAQHLYSFLMMAMLLGGAGLVLYWEFDQPEPSPFRWIDLGIFCLLFVFAAIFIRDVVIRSGGSAHPPGLRNGRGLRAPQGGGVGSIREET